MCSRAYFEALEHEVTLRLVLNETLPEITAGHELYAMKKKNVINCYMSFSTTNRCVGVKLEVENHTPRLGAGGG